MEMETPTATIHAPLSLPNDAQVLPSSLSVTKRAGRTRAGGKPTIAGKGRSSPRGEQTGYLDHLHMVLTVSTRSLKPKNLSKTYNSIRLGPSLRREQIIHLRASRKAEVRSIYKSFVYTEKGKGARCVSETTCKFRREIWKVEWGCLHLIHASAPRIKALYIPKG